MHENILSLTESSFKPGSNNSGRNDLKRLRRVRALAVLKLQINLD